MLLEAQYASKTLTETFNSLPDVIPKLFIRNSLLSVYDVIAVYATLYFNDQFLNESYITKASAGWFTKTGFGAIQNYVRQWGVGVRYCKFLCTTH